jgi:hypothetical protein
MPKKNAPVPVPPGSGIRFTHDDDTHVARAREQKAYFKALADRVERGEPLDDMEAGRVATILRLHADQIPAEQPRKRGDAPRVDYGSIAQFYARMIVHHGIKPADAVNDLSIEFNVSTVTIRKAVRQYGDEAIRMTAGATYIKKKKPKC